MSQISIKFDDYEVVLSDWELDMNNRAGRWIMTDGKADKDAGFFITEKHNRLIYNCIYGDSNTGKMIKTISQMYGLFFIGKEQRHPFSIDQMQEAKNHFDKFLYRVNTLKAFL